MNAHAIASANAEQARLFVLELAKQRGLLDGIAEAFLKSHGVKDGKKYVQNARIQLQAVFDDVLKDFRNSTALAACTKRAREVSAYATGLRAMGRTFPVAIPSDDALQAFRILHHNGEDEVLIIATHSSIFMR